MTYENLLYDVEERVCTITLNRPDEDERAKLASEAGVFGRAEDGGAGL